jgi:hypothetical protein
MKKKDVLNWSMVICWVFVALRVAKLHSAEPSVWTSPTNPTPAMACPQTRRLMVSPAMPTCPDLTEWMPELTTRVAYP